MKREVKGSATSKRLENSAINHQSGGSLISRDEQIEKKNFVTIEYKQKLSFFFHMDSVPPPPPGCGRSVTDVWGLGAHRARLRCPDDVSYDMCECGVTGGALNLNCTGYPEHGRYGDIPLERQIPRAEAGIEPEISWLVLRSSDQATRLVTSVCCRHKKLPSTAAHPL
jgi:hypothetical protein